MIKFQKFLKTILELLNIDKILNKGEFKYAITNIKDNADLNRFLEVISDRKKRSERPCPVCTTSIHSILKTGKLGCDKCSTHFSIFLLDKLGQKDNSTLIDLEVKMKLAIETEKYEEAAMIRDQIKELTNK